MFDVRPVGYLIGLLVCFLGAMMFVPMVFDIFARNGHWTSFAISGGLTSVLGGILAISCANTVDEGLTIRQTFMFTTGVFLVLPVFGALPFIWGGTDLSLVDAFFETMSGLTTTGATVLDGLESLPDGILVWRGLLQWFGGISIIIVAMVFLPLLRVGGMQLFRWESYDTLGTILPRAAEITRSISMIYVSLTAACALGYAFSGLSLFDAFVHSMTTIATGGFANHDTSFQDLGARAEYVGALFMVLAALPFIRYFQLVTGSVRPLFRDSQIKSFLAIAIVIVVALVTWQFAMNGQDAEPAFRKALFNGISILTGTGYASDDYSRWGSFPITLFFLIGLFGGCAGSTSCSIKIFRIQLLAAFVISQVKRIVYPNAVVTVRYEGRQVRSDVSASVMTFFVTFLSTLVFIALLLSLSGLDLVTSLSGAAACLANIGPGLGQEIGPAGNYASLGDFAKWVLAATMLLGRLELMAVYALLTTRFWRG